MVSLGKALLFFLACTTLNDVPYSKPEINRAVVIAIDGVRRYEAQPALKRLKTGLYANWYSEGCRVSQPYNMSLPAYATIFSGRAQEDIKTNYFQSVIQGDTFFTRYRSELFSAWKPIKNVMGDSSRAVIVGGNPENFEDKLIFKSYMSYTQNSKFVFLHFGDTDEAAHRGEWKGYTDSLDRAVRYSEAIVAINEAERPKETLYVILTDHGRGSWLWQHHGTFSPESGEIWAYIISPFPVKLSDCSHIGIHNFVRSFLDVR